MDAFAQANPKQLPVLADLEKGFRDTPQATAVAVRCVDERGLVEVSIEDATGDPARVLFEPTQAAERIVAAEDAARSMLFRRWHSRLDGFAIFWNVRRS